MSFSGAEVTRLSLGGAIRPPYGSFAGKVSAVDITGTINVLEEDDTLAAAGVIIINGYINIVEEDDVLTASGLVIQDISGTLSITEDNDILTAEGNVVENFVINVLDLNLTIPRADEDPVEQQRILIENYDIILKALRNLGL